MPRRIRCSRLAHRAPVWTAPLALATVLVLIATVTAPRTEAQGFIAIPSPSRGASVVAADLNRDGRPDLVVASPFSSNVVVYLGDGVGGFGPPTTVNGIPGNGAVAVGDLDGDGKPDLVLPGTSSALNHVYLLFGDGAGGFPREKTVLIYYPTRAVAIADVNGDGHLDLLITDETDGSLLVMTNDGSGGFSAPTAFACGPDPVAIAVDDLNGDGKPDVAIANRAAATVSVLLGDGGAGFHPRVAYPTGSSPDAVAIGDLNGDGFPDLAVTNETDGNVSFFAGDGTGSFTGAGTQNLIGGAPYGIALADLDGDEYPDVVTIGSNTATTWVNWLRGQGGWSFAAPISQTTTGDGTSIAVRDVNGDGHPDVIAMTALPNEVQLLLAHQGNLAFPSTLAMGSAPNLLRLADLSGDGKPDIVTANFGANTVSVRLGAGGGTFGAKTDYATGIQPASVAIADVSGDGKPDLVVANDGANTVSVLLGTGAGGFGAKTDFATGNQPISVAVGDVNGDGKPDIVTANNGAGTVSLLLGTGGGNFATHTDISAGGQPNGVALADLNGDGKLDIVTADYSTNFASVLIGNGSGGFATHVDYPTGTNPISVAVADVNGDGKPDVVVANAGASSVSVLLGTGTGTLGAKTDYAAGSNPTSVVVGDVDGDGRPDLVVTDNTSSSITVLPGDGVGAFAPLGHFGATAYTTGTNPNSSAVGDIDGDGKLDVVVANKGDGTVSVFPGLRPAHLALTANPAVALPGAPLVLTASETADPVYGAPPSEPVAFFDGLHRIGVADLISGVATLTVSNPLLAGHRLWATYAYASVFGVNFYPPIAPDLVMSSVLSPDLLSVGDVANDQGGHVQLTWDASPIDRIPNDSIDQYWIWRAVPPAMAALRLARGEQLAKPGEPPRVGALRAQVDGAQTYYWEFLASPNADGLPHYSYVATTTSDSLASSNPMTTFMVEAKELSDGLHWASAPDSGYSVDNLAPPTPAPFTGAYASGATTLSWSESPTPDLAAFALYRGASAGFVPDPGNLVVMQLTTGYVDHASAGSYYKLAAIDIHGNASPYALLTPTATTGVAPDPPAELALAGVRPNPATGDAFVVQFSLPRGGNATLEILDLAGRRLVRREVGGLGPGRHTIDLAGERSLAAGIYLVRLTQGAETRTARAAVLR